MYTNRESLLREVMANGFSAYDLQLYLDTHPYDTRAMNFYNENIRRYNDLKDEYESMYGPLLADHETNIPWNWIDSPWPWEMDRGGMNNVEV